MSAPRGPRVLFPFVGSQVGGATVSTAEMVRRLVAAGHVRPIVVMPREGPAARVVREAGLEPTLHDPDVVRGTTMQVSTVGWGGKLRAVPTYAAMHRNALMLARRHQADIVHLNEDRLVLPWGTAARRLGIPVVWHVRQERPNPLLDALRLRLSDHLVFVADANRSRFARARRLPPSTTLHNVVDVARFHPTEDLARAKRAAGLDPDRLTLTFVGNLFARKRPDWVLRAAATLQARLPLQVLVVGAPLGPSDYVARVRELAERAPHPEHVHLLGGRDDVADLLRASDLLTLPSIVRGEAFPRAVIEAMACGVPVVATDVAGVREAIDDGESGLLVDPDDFEGYVAALERLLLEHDLRRAMGRHAAGVARSRFDGASLAATLERLYDGLRAERPA